MEKIDECCGMPELGVCENCPDLETVEWGKTHKPSGIMAGSKIPDINALDYSGVCEACEDFERCSSGKGICILSGEFVAKVDLDAANRLLSLWRGQCRTLESIRPLLEETLSYYLSSYDERQIIVNDFMSKLC
jgi:hypothetical protein